MRPTIKLSWTLFEEVPLASFNWQADLLWITVFETPFRPFNTIAAYGSINLKMSWTINYISRRNGSCSFFSGGFVPKTLALSCMFGIIIISLASGTSAAPPTSRPASRALRELHANHQQNTQLFKNMQATTLHSLQVIETKCTAIYDYTKAID